jgi:hypothetical protein
LIGTTTNSGEKLVVNGNATFGGTNAKLLVDVTNQIIKTQYNSSDNGLFLNFVNNQYRLGDFNFVGLNGTFIDVDDTTGIITNVGQGNFVGLKLDLSNRIFSIGDSDLVANSTRIIIEDNPQTVTVDAPGGDIKLGEYGAGNKANSINFNTANFQLESIPTSATAGALIGYITVHINGTQRKIPYYAV